MFKELTINEQMNIEGGFLPAIPLGVKMGITVIGVIFTAGAVNGCTHEAAKG